MTDEIQCMVCGEPAVHFFGSSRELPVCVNVVCQQCILDEVNAALQLAAEEGEQELCE